MSFLTIIIVAVIAGLTAMVVAASCMCCFDQCTNGPCKIYPNLKK